MTDADRERPAAIRARVGAATPGEWEVGHVGEERWYRVASPHGVVAHIDLRLLSHLEHTDGNADFIANARSDVPWLLQLVDELTRVPADRNEETGYADGVRAERERCLGVVRKEQAGCTGNIVGLQARSDADDMLAVIQAEVMCEATCKRLAVAIAGGGLQPDV